MADISSGASSGAPSFESKQQVAEQTRARRETYIKGANGDAVGNNWLVPKADFGTYLGYKGATPEELKGDKPLSGARVIELALQAESKELGEGAAKNGNKYRNIAVSWGRFNNEPGRERDMIKDGLDAIRQGPEKGAMEHKISHMSPTMQAYVDETRKMQKDSHNDNVKYLEMQYRFSEMSKQDGILSNLMKVRNDAVTRTIRGGQG